LLPIRDENPSRRRPFATWAIVVACAFVFFRLQPSTGPDAAVFVYENATIPCEVTTGQPLSIAEIEGAPCDSAPEDLAFPAKSVSRSLLASLFMHGSIGHLLGNLWVLLIFGNNIEDKMGHGRYLVFYLVGGLLASLAHVAKTPSSTVPVVGASGAIASVMGAYLVLFPAARVQSIIPPFFFWPFRMPAFIFLGIWFIGQFALAGEESLIAWEAHVAGFVVGAAYAAFRRRSLLAR
jgi:membrane associated rhomboid family serine protease